MPCTSFKQTPPSQASTYPNPRRSRLLLLLRRPPNKRGRRRGQRLARHAAAKQGAVPELHLGAQIAPAVVVQVKGHELRRGPGPPGEAAAELFLRNLQVVFPLLPLVAAVGRQGRGVARPFQRGGAEGLLDEGLRLEERAEGEAVGVVWVCVGGWGGWVESGWIGRPANTESNPTRSDSSDWSPETTTNKSPPPPLNQNVPVEVHAGDGAARALHGVDGGGGGPRDLQVEGRANVLRALVVDVDCFAMVVGVGRGLRGRLWLLGGLRFACVLFGDHKHAYGKR